MIFIPLGILAFAGIYLLATYNGLVAKRNMASNAFSTIDVMLKKRHDLIPNLVAAVKGFASHEKDTFARVIELRNRAMSQGISDAERFDAESQLAPQLGKLIAIAENYPELTSGEQFLNLQRNLTEIEEQISAARRAYNAAVLENNNAVDMFPSNLIAASFGFTSRDFFQAEVVERGAVSINS